MNDTAFGEYKSNVIRSFQSMLLSNENILKSIQIEYNQLVGFITKYANDILKIVNGKMNENDMKKFEDTLNGDPSLPTDALDNLSNIINNAIGKTNKEYNIDNERLLKFNNMLKDVIKQKKPNWNVGGGKSKKNKKQKKRKIGTMRNKKIVRGGEIFSTTVKLISITGFLCESHLENNEKFVNGPVTGLMNIAIVATLCTSPVIVNTGFALLSVFGEKLGSFSIPEYTNTYVKNFNELFRNNIKNPSFESLLQRFDKGKDKNTSKSNMSINV